MPNQYIILSLSHSTKDEAVFWRSDNAGYTIVPFAAGIYSEDDIKRDPAYYNDGYNTIAIPLTNIGIQTSGIKCHFDSKKLKKFIEENKYKK
ncbi:MAG: hypothetical protein V4547_17380 [Bacteroidota bacterium]